MDPKDGLQPPSSTLRQLGGLAASTTTMALPIVLKILFGFKPFFEFFLAELCELCRF